VVVVGTVTGSLALPQVVRRLPLELPDVAAERRAAEELLAESNRAGIAWIESRPVTEAERGLLDRLRADSDYLDRALRSGSEGTAESMIAGYGRLRRQMIGAQRDAVFTARASSRFPERAVRTVLASLDAEETALRSELTNPASAA